MAAQDRRRLRFPFGWLVALVLLAASFAVFLVDGFVHPAIAIDATGAVDRDDESTTQVTDAVLNGGPAIEVRPDGVRSAGVPARTIALTFDDGPDPEWTPQILAVLARHRVPATFFVIGSQVAQHPELVRAMRTGGHEVGLHTFTHVDLSTIGADQVRDEIRRTEVALAGAIGETSYITRPPYSSEPYALTGRQLDTVHQLSDDGQLTVLSDVDSLDWARPGVPAIVANSTPKDGAGAVVLFHDGGGDRSESVVALDRLIPQLQQQGYRFTTVTDGLHLPAADQPASATDLRAGRVLLGAVAVATTVVRVFSWLLAVGLGLVLLRLLIVSVLALRHSAVVRRRTAARPPVTEPVSVIVPAYNEEDCIASTLRSLLASTHPIEVVVVDDGSTDRTSGVVAELDLPGVRLFRQVNSGKATALNTGLAVARHEIVVMMDGDTVFEPGTVAELVAPFADPRVGAVAGNAKISNKRRLIVWMQHIEYVIGFSLDRRAYDILGCMTTVPGAVGAFRRSVVAEVGGLSEDTLAEDTDLTMAIVNAGHRVVYQRRAVAWTEAPETVGQLWRQRYRWSYGTMQSMWKHRRGAGFWGRLAVAQHVLFQILLPLVAPLIDAFLVYGLVFGDPLRTAVAWSGVLALQMAVAVLAFRLDREPLWPILLMPLQQIAYRQLMYVVLIRSTATALGGIRLRWQKLQRSGTANAHIVAAMASTSGADVSPPPSGHARRPVADRRGSAAPRRHPSAIEITDVIPVVETGVAPRSRPAPLVARGARRAEPPTGRHASR